MKDETDIIFENKEFYASILNSIVNGIWVSDKADVILYANEKMGEIAGIPVEEIVGARVLFDFSEDTLKHFSPLYLEAKETLHQVYYEAVPVITPAGRQSYQSGWLIPRSVDDMFDGMICTVEDITEHKQAEDELVKHRQHLEELVEERTAEINSNAERFKRWKESNFIGIIQSNAEGTIIETNDTILAMLGYSRQDLIEGKLDWTRLTPPEFLHLDMKAMDEASIKGFWTPFEKEYFRKDGSRVPIIIGGSIYKGDPDEYIVFVIDITEQKQAKEDILLHSEIMNRMTEGVYLVRMDGIIVYTNPKFEQMFGYEPGEMIGKHASIVNYPTEINPEEMAKEILDVLDKEGEWHGEIQNIKKDGTPFWSYASVVVFDHSEHGKVLIAVHNDITERKKVENDLKEKILLNKILMDSMPCVALLLRPSTREIIASNKMAEQVGAVPGKQCFATWGQSDKPCQWCRAPKLWATGKAQHETFGGLGIIWDAHWIPVSEDLYMHFAFDITEKKRTEEELKKMQKLESIGVLAGGIAHDFNNLLSAIRNNLFLSKMNIDREGETYKNMESAEKAIDRATNLTQQLLTFAKGGAPIKEIKSVVNIIKESTEFVLSGSGIKCVYINADDLWPVEIDEMQFSQVIHNLILNAVQSMPEGGTIRVSTENYEMASDAGLPLKEERYIKIVIQDKGIGIAEENLHNIFDPYFTTKEMGQGLGLSIVYSIIKSHNGYIKVESVVGAGTTFIIYLPASKKRIKEEKTAADVLVTRPGKILLMDDEEVIRETLGQLLIVKGYEIESARDGDEAIELYQKAMEISEPFDAVILDLTIRGGMGGKETVKRLLEINPDIKAIVASGYSNDPVLGNFKEFGFVDVYYKAARPDDLLAAVNRVIKG